VTTVHTLDTWRRIGWRGGPLLLALAACGGGGQDDVTAETSSRSEAPQAVPGATQVASYHFRNEAELRRFVEQNIASRNLRPQFEFVDGRMRVHLLRSDADLNAEAVSETPLLGADGVQEATLVYRFKFSPRFDFVRQGKLPGLGSFTPHFGGNKDDPPAKDSWSYRQMWLKFSNESEPRPDQYLYDQFRSQGETGEHYRAAAGNTFAQNDWTTTHLYIKLNDKRPGSQAAQANGVAELWRDNVPLVCNRGLKFRGDGYTSASNVGRVAYHFYHGGAKSPIEVPASAQGQFIDFDYIEVHEGRATPRDDGGRFKTCNLPSPPHPDQR
jgi:hypothetical protein